MNLSTGAVVLFVVAVLAALLGGVCAGMLFSRSRSGGGSSSGDSPDRPAGPLPKGRLPTATDANQRRGESIPFAERPTEAIPIVRPADLGRADTVAIPRAAPDGVALANFLIALHDSCRDDAVRDQIDAELRRHNIVRVTSAAGAPFDPAVHRAVGSAPAPGPGRQGRVADMSRPGWQGPQGMLRHVEVLTWR